MPRILLLEDERAIADIVEVALERAGFTVVVRERLADGRAQLASGSFDLLLLDLGLPDGDGMELCRELRRDSDLPVVIITARGSEIDRVVGLELGADDYLVKPFSPRELVARVKAVLRRATKAQPADEETLRLGRLVIVPPSFRVTLDHIAVPLTPTEFAILRALAESPSRVFSRSALIDRARGEDTYLTERTVDSHVRGIRRKFATVEPGADPVETVFGVGYRARVLE
jgi:DNA-binding response OmpR family regulator